MLVRGGDHGIVQRGIDRRGLASLGQAGNEVCHHRPGQRAIGLHLLDHLRDVDRLYIDRIYVDRLKVD